MKKSLLVLGLLAAVTLARPAPADAHFSLSLGLPGFGLFIHEPCPRVAYAPPIYYRPPVVYYPPVYYPTSYPSYRRYPGRGRHYGWYQHRRHWDD
jgi:hypothetical protein